MNQRTNRYSVATLTTTALLTALMLVLSYTPLGFIPIGPISITLVHLPVLIGLLAQGLPTGFFLGVLFGVISLLRAIMTPSGIFDPLFWNPLVSVLPRAVIPVAAWGMYRLTLRGMGTRKGAEHVAVAAGALVGSLVNTGGVLSMIYLFCTLGHAEIPGMTTEAVGLLLITVAVTNGIPEAIASTMITPAVVLALKKAMRLGATGGRGRRRRA